MGEREENTKKCKQNNMQEMIILTAFFGQILLLLNK